MFKTLLATSILFFSGLTFAADVKNDDYFLIIKDKHQTISDMSLLNVGHMSESYVGSMKEKHKQSDCNSYINPDFPAPVQLYDASNSGTGVILSTISHVKNTFHIVLTVSYNENFSTENSIKLNDKCTIANSVSTSIEVNWAGDVTLGHRETIKLPNNNELYLEVTDNLPVED